MTMHLTYSLLEDGNSFLGEHLGDLESRDDLE